MDLGSGPIEGDAFGQALLARQEGRVVDIVSERDDGLVELDSFDYFSPPQGPLWEWVLARVGHRILDIGAGAGREALALQAMGKEVVALDVSPGAIEVCRRRGVVSTFLGTLDDLVAAGLGRFDSFIAINSLSLVFNPTEAVGLLDSLSAVGHPDWALVGTIRDPYRTDEPVHLAYQEANRAAGRMSGEVRWRTRFQRLADPWHAILWVCREELAELAARVGWRLVETSPVGDAIYGAVLRPEPGD
ncbi:MAG: methyltransferase domain-containing protein [Acidimicrobiaceae bacterium]|nr:methyltransferase domain-containing protein [Acidimicrobiaceae bacterium]